MAHPNRATRTAVSEGSRVDCTVDGAIDADSPTTAHSCTGSVTESTIDISV